MNDSRALTSNVGGRLWRLTIDLEGRLKLNGTEVDAIPVGEPQILERYDLDTLPAYVDVPIKASAYVQTKLRMDDNGFNRCAVQFYFLKKLPEEHRKPHSIGHEKS